MGDIIIYEAWVNILVIGYINPTEKAYVFSQAQETNHNCLMWGGQCEEPHAGNSHDIDLSLTYS